jgi:hypothetical protein
MSYSALDFDPVILAMPELVLQLISGLASPFIFVPSLMIGWFARRAWQVPLGAVIVAVLSEAELLLIELPGASPDWGSEPFALVAPLAWCATGFLLRIWQRRTLLLRRGEIRVLPVVAGMVLGASIVGMLALGVGLLYLREASLEYHTMQFGRAPGADYEALFFQYLFPGLLLGQLAGGLIGRVLARPIVQASA